MNDRNEPLKFLVALLGARCHYAVPTLLKKHGMLERFFTDIHSGDWPCKFLQRAPLPGPFRAAAKRLSDRKIPLIDPNQIITFPMFGLLRAFRHYRAVTPGAVLQGYAIDNERFCRRVANQSWGQANAVYGFNGAALELFQTAKKRGFVNVLEQTIAPYAVVEPLLEAERLRWPNWESQGTSPEQWHAIAERERQEWALADLIICGSQFVVDGIQSLVDTKAKLIVVPYGINLSEPGHVRHYDGTRPLRVLFVGTLELRKGIQYLGQAAKAISSQSIQFRAVGPIRVSESAQRDLGHSIELVGPVPRSRLIEHLDWADVFVLPTLAEGSALVVYEALAAGLPVITTPNAGSVLVNDEEGFLVNLRDPAAICEKLEWFANHPESVQRMSQNALLRAADFTVERYGERLIQAFAAL